MFTKTTLNFDNGNCYDYFTTDAKVKDLFHLGSRIIRTARRNHYGLTVSIVDVHTGELLFRFYHMPYGGTYSTRLNGGCKFGGQFHQGMNF